MWKQVRSWKAIRDCMCRREDGLVRRRTLPHSTSLVSGPAAAAARVSATTRARSPALAAATAAALEVSASDGALAASLPPTYCRCTCRVERNNILSNVGRQVCRDRCSPGVRRRAGGEQGAARYLLMLLIHLDTQSYLRSLTLRSCWHWHAVSGASLAAAWLHLLQIRPSVPRQGVCSEHAIVQEQDKRCR